MILELGDIRVADAPRVGPKMARLGQLAAAGWRVPDGYAITAEALSDWLPATAQAELDGLLGALVPGQVAGDPGALGGPGALTGVMARARALVESQPLPAALADAVAAAHDRLERRVRAVGGGVTAGGDGALRVAVRSSAVSEDGTGASFAGQYETYLGVSGVPDVLSHIRKCWASGYSAHALEYRRRHGTGGGSPHEHDLAVGVLELVDVRSAGVVFTLDPVTGSRDTLVIEANWGFGESVVSGQVSPDHWTVDRATGDILTRRTGDKQVWSVFSPAAGRVVLEPAPPGRSARACLTDAEVRYLCRQAARIEAAEEGVPQDVEWAIARGLPFPDSVFILQHRPETTWTGDPPSSGVTAEPPAAAGFDPVRYALRNVFRVPGA